MPIDVFSYIFIFHLNLTLNVKQNITFNFFYVTYDIFSILFEVCRIDTNFFTKGRGHLLHNNKIK